MRKTKVLLLFVFFSLNASSESTRRFPVANSDRPFTLPSQIAEVDLQFTYSDISQFAVSVSANYGITDNLQVNASYDGVTLKDFEAVQAEKSFHVGFGYFMFETPFLSSMLDIDFPLYVDANWAQNIKVAAPSSIPLWSAAKLGLTILQSGVIDFQFAPYVAADINIPARIGWQATEALSLGLGTNLAKFNIARPDGAGGTLGHEYIWTTTPLYLNALYALSDTWDLIGRIGFHDVQRNVAENFYAWVGVGFRFGRMSQ